ncbi:MAG: hypothetical protein ACM3YE_05050 [Bacteroidota bacterium]
MLKLIKYSLLLTVFFYLSQHLNNFKSLPSFAFPEEIPKVFSQIISSNPNVNQQQSPSTAQLIERIQKNDLREIHDIWKQLGIKSELFQKSAPILTESYKLSLHHNGSPLYVFKIADQESNDWQYLFFNIRNRSWNFWGYIDLPKQALTEPISRTLAIENRDWLIITSKSNSPDLPGMFQDRWYDLNGPKLKEVLGYNVYQDIPQPGFTKRYSATISQTGISGGTYFIDLNLKLTYFSYRASLPHLETALSLSHKVRYIWDSYRQSFINNHSQSVNLHTYGADEILFHNYLQIEDLAVTGDLTQRTVIRDFLNLCSNSKEKRRISQILR